MLALIIWAFLISNLDNYKDIFSDFLSDVLLQNSVNYSAIRESFIVKLLNIYLYWYKLQPLSKDLLCYYVSAGTIN